jgi:hypothetical protein
MKICNCDRCDGLEINRWIPDFCQHIADDCLLQGYSSGYRTIQGADGLTGIMMEYTVDKTAGAGSIPILDPLLEASGIWNVTCKSGNETREWQDVSGPLYICRYKWDFVTAGAYKGCYKVNHGPKSSWMYTAYRG